MSRNCLILAPPLCGARALARQLVERGYDPGRCLPSLMDPSVSSYEDEQVVYLNARLFGSQKAMNIWNHDPRFNALSFFLDSKMMSVQWPRHLAAPAVVGLGKKPWVRKDPQFIFTWRHWQENVWNLCPEENRPLVVMLLRYPTDWFNAIFARIDSGVWAGVPKDMDYFRGLWLECAEQMLRTARCKELEGRVFVMTLDHLCISEFQIKLATSLGLASVDMPCLDVSQIRHASGHQLDKLDETLGETWDRWQWTALRNEV